MKTIAGLSIAFLLLGVVFIPAGDLEIDTEQAAAVDVAAYFQVAEKSESEINEIAESFYRELELLSQDNPVSVTVYTGDKPFSANNVYSTGTYTVELEIIKSDWGIELYFEIPFVFFVYHNNYEIEAIFRVYHEGESNPETVKRYRVSNNGPKILQLLEKNPHDGGLQIPYSRRVSLEKATRDDLVEIISRDLMDTIKKNRG